MALVIPQETSSNYERPPEGNHVAVCCSLVDLGTQFSETYQKSQRKILIEWELAEETKENGEPHYIDQIYTFSMNEKSTLRLALESWRGVKFSPDDFGKFELSNLIGKGCMLNIIHTEKGDKVYANIASIARLPKGMKAPTLQATPRIFSMAPGEYEAAALTGLRERIVEKIKESPEWAALNTGHGAAKKPQPPKESGVEFVEDDDIPF
jgi:hypothetical protein